jgi:hypothetical protein
MLMSDGVDMIPTTMHEVRARTFLRVDGYLCNGPTHIGKQVSVDDFNSYMAEVTTQRNPQNRWHHGFQRYIKRTTRFCLVRPVHEYAMSCRSARKEVAHLLFLPPGTYRNSLSPSTPKCNVAGSMTRQNSIARARQSRQSTVNRKQARPYNSRSKFDFILRQRLYQE